MTDLLSQIKDGDPYALAFLVTTFCILALLYSFAYQYRVWNWPSVWGQLQHGGLQKSGGASSPSDQDYVSDVSYSYEIDGRAYTGTRLSAMQTATSHNARGLLELQLAGIEQQENLVKVYYNAANPQKSYLIRGSKVQLLFTLSCLILAIAVGGKCLAKLGLL